MNLEEYHRRIEAAHTVTGVSSFWQDAQDAKALSDEWERVASMLASSLREVETHPESLAAWHRAYDALRVFAELKAGQ